MKYIINIAFVIFFSICSYSQDKTDVIEHVVNKFNTDYQYEFYTTYNLYKTYTSSTVIESEKGILSRRAKSQYYFKYGNLEFFCDEKISAQIDHINKSIIVDNNMTKIPDQFNVKDIIKGFKVTETQKLPSGWKVLLYADGTASKYDYIKIDLFVNSDYTLRRQVLYYANVVDFSEDFTKKKLSRPRLEVTYLKTSGKSKLKTIDFNKYFVIKEKKVYAKPEFREYKITDNRN
ncbi:hypothetical protein ACLI08_13290 [Flavobacterium sp. RNTU_13]|uniref:hypothetical protein n=1 Tax=Flavobacterium sp. RNTU_13 TaxID=3375145 RepID=UPI003986ABDF